MQQLAADWGIVKNLQWSGELILKLIVTSDYYMNREHSSLKLLEVNGEN